MARACDHAGRKFLINGLGASPRVTYAAAMNIFKRREAATRVEVKPIFANSQSDLQMKQFFRQGWPPLTDTEKQRQAEERKEGIRNFQEIK